MARTAYYVSPEVVGHWQRVPDPRNPAEPCRGHGGEWRACTNCGAKQVVSLHHCYTPRCKACGCASSDVNPSELRRPKYLR